MFLEKKDANNNRYGIRGWLNPTKFGIERVSFMFMRISGVFLLVFFVAHIIQEAAILDRLSWGKLLQTAYSPEGFILLTIMIGMSVFHTINGIRLMINQGGVGVGRPKRPDYPYEVRSQNYKNKLCIYASIGLAALAMWYGLQVLFEM